MFGVAAAALVGYVVYRDHEKKEQIADLSEQLKNLSEKSKKR